jgi:hypothetical protein
MVGGPVEMASRPTEAAAALIFSSGESCKRWIQVHCVAAGNAAIAWLVYKEQEPPTQSQGLDDDGTVLSTVGRGAFASARATGSCCAGADGSG